MRKHGFCFQTGHCKEGWDLMGHSQVLSYTQCSQPNHEHCMLWSIMKKITFRDALTLLGTLLGTPVQLPSIATQCIYACRDGQDERKGDFSNFKCGMFVCV